MTSLHKFSLVTIILILPACIGQNKSDTSKQLDARQAYDAARYEYERELTLFRNYTKAISDKERTTLAQKIKDEIFLKNEQYNEDHRRQWFGKRWLKPNPYENFPFVQYKMYLDSWIHRLEKARNRLYWKNEGVGYLIGQLAQELDAIRRYIVTTKDYQHERSLFEQQKIEVKKPKEVKAKKIKSKSKA